MAIISDASSLFSSKSFLIVDDFQGMRSMMREMLKAFGAKDIDMCSNGSEAIAQIGKSKYDVVLCDYNLGSGRNGQQVLEEAKFRNLIGPSTAWIMVTAEKTSEMVLGAAEYTPDDYIIKPINETTIKTRILKAMAKKEALFDIEKAAKAKNHTKALALCDEQLKNAGSNTTELLRIKTNLLLSTSHYEGAKQLFEQILAVRDVPWAKTGLAKVYFQTADYDTARSLLEEVVEEHRSYLEAYDWLAKTLEQIGELSEAQRVLVRCAELSPNSVMRQRTLGEIAQKRGDLDVAEKAFRKTLVLGEHSVLKTHHAYLGLAKICSDKNNPAEALKILSSVQKEFDSAETTLQAKVAEGMVYRKSGDLVNAKKVAQEVAATVKEIANRVPSQISVEAAELMMETGDKESASELLQMAVKNNHEDEKLISLVNGVYTKGNMQEEGKKLVEASRKEVAETNNRGISLAREGKLDDAVEMLRNAKTMLPNNTRILMNLAYVMVLHMQKNGHNNTLIREARESVDRVAKLNPSEKRLSQLVGMLEALPG
ncbi:MAG: response regulator [Sulfuricellaceae bacterium]|nr:response regulator [Sulfuricellaceae bacterium]